MQTLRKNAFFLLVAISPFVAGVMASVHVHRHVVLKTTPVDTAVVTSCCGHSHSKHEPADSSIPANPDHDCQDCLLCHFLAQSFWFVPVSLEADTEKICVPCIQPQCKLIFSEIPGIYQGRAPPSALIV